jgi:hypothetical protein
MRPRELEVDFINRNCAEFRGFGIREVYTREFGRPPVYNTRTRSWAASPARVTDLAALCESRGWLVTYSEPPPPVADATPETTAAEPQDALW